MTEPRYRFWRPIQPVEGQPIPEGAMFKHSTDKKWQPAYCGERWIGWPADLDWRVPVEVVPIDLAVNAIMQGFQFSEGLRSAGLPHLSVSFAGGLRAKTQEELREMVVAKLRELSQEKTNATD